MSKKDDFFSFGTDDLSEISAGFDRQINAHGATDKSFAKARVLCIRGKFADALKIYEGVVDEDFENVDGYIGILRVHSKNFTAYDGAEIENDVEVIRQIARGEYTKDEEFTAYLTARKKHFEKGAEDKRKKAEADRIAAEKARQQAAEEAKRLAEQKAAAKKRAEEETKKRAEKEAAAKKKKKEQTGKLYDEKRYDEAFPDILRFAEEGDVDFCFKAGYCYSTGKGVAKDVDKAIYWYTKSAEKGEKVALYNLGWNYFYEKKDYSKAKYWWEKAAAQGYERAKESLKEHFSPVQDGGILSKDEAGYLFGKMTTESLKRAYPSIKYYAEKGDAEFQNYLAFYYDGAIVKQNVVKPDEKTCFYWFKKSAEQGNANSQYFVGEMYYEGIGCECNKKEGIAWLKKSAAQGECLAQFYLEDLGIEY